MLTKEEGAAATNEQRQDAEASDTIYNDTISDLIGQLFKCAARINQLTSASCYLDYLDGDISCTVIARGRQYEIIPRQIAGVNVLYKALSQLELLEALTCGRS